MQSLIQLRGLVAKVPLLLEKLPTDAVAHKPAPDKWSPKEELGHLLDSAANNHQRVVRVQADAGLAMPGYQQDHWVAVHRYQQRDWHELIALWRALNEQLLIAAESVPGPSWAHTCTIADSGPLTLEFVVDDYVRHMLHHLEHIGIKSADLEST